MLQTNTLAKLIYQYLFAINPSDKDSQINGLYILCVKDINGNQINIHDKADEVEIEISPFVRFLGFNVDDIKKEESNILTLILSEIQSQLRKTNQIYES